MVVFAFVSELKDPASTAGTYMDEDKAKHNTNLGMPERIEGGE